MCRRICGKKHYLQTADLKATDNFSANNNLRKCSIHYLLTPQRTLHLKLTFMHDKQIHVYYELTQI